MDGTTHGLVALDALRSQVEPSMKDKPVSSTFSWSLHQLLPLGSCPVRVPVQSSFSTSQISFSLPKLLRSWCLSQQQ